MSTTEVVVREKGAVSYTPFGAADSVKLSVQIVSNYLATPTKSGRMPDERDCIKFIAMCQAKRLNPFEGDAFLLGYDTQNGPQFSLVTAHQAYLKRAEVSKEFEGMESGLIVKDPDGVREIEGDFYLPDQEVLGGWAKVYRKDRRIPTYRRIRMARFNKGFGEWAKDAAGMICKCAEADALRSAFPTMLGSLYTREEVEVSEIGESPSQKPVRPLADIVKQRALPEASPESQVTTGGIVKPTPQRKAFRAPAPPQPEPEPEPEPDPEISTQPADENPGAESEVEKRAPTPPPAPPAPKRPPLSLVPEPAEPPPPSDAPMTPKQQAAENAVMEALGDVPGSEDKDVWDWCAKKWPNVAWSKVQAFNQVSDFVCGEIVKRSPELKKYIAAVTAARKPKA